MFKVKRTIALLAVVLAGCSQGVRELEIKPQPSKETVILPLSIQASNEVTLRSGGSEDPLQKVHAVLLAFYSTEAGREKLLRTEEIRIQDASELSELNAKAPKGNYKLVVIANPTEAIRERVKVGAALTRLTEPEFIRASELSRQVDVSTLAISMFNEQGVVSISDTDFADAPASITKRRAITLEPSLSRVLVYGAPTLKGGTQGSEPARYLINNVSNSVSLLRPLNLLSTGVAEVAGDKSDRGLRYAAGRLWALWNNTEPTDIANELANHTADSYKRATWQTILPSVNAYDTERQSLSVYAKETAVPSRAYLQGVVPCVVIAYPYVPDGLSLKSGEGWVNYRGGYYTETEFKSFVTGASAPSDELKNAIQRANLTEDSFSEAFSKEGIDFYYKALSHYVVYIRHFSTATAGNAYGRYGLIRGNEYRIHLICVQSPGQATPPILGGNMTPIAEQAYAGLSVSITPVTMRDQDEAL